MVASDLDLSGARGLAASAIIGKTFVVGKAFMSVSGPGGRNGSALGPTVVDKDFAEEPKPEALVARPPSGCDGPREREGGKSRQLHWPIGFACQTSACPQRQIITGL